MNYMLYSKSHLLSACYDNRLPTFVSISSEKCRKKKRQRQSMLMQTCHQHFPAFLKTLTLLQDLQVLITQTTYEKSRHGSYLS